MTSLLGSGILTMTSILGKMGTIVGIAPFLTKIENEHLTENHRYFWTTQTGDIGDFKPVFSRFGLKTLKKE